jgi:hypothetical protein
MSRATEYLKRRLLNESNLFKEIEGHVKNALTKPFDYELYGLAIYQLADNSWKTNASENNKLVPILLKYRIDKNWINEMFRGNHFPAHRISDSLKKIGEQKTIQCLKELWTIYENMSKRPNEFEMVSGEEFNKREREYNEKQKARLIRSTTKVGKYLSENEKRLFIVDCKFYNEYFKTLGTKSYLVNESGAMNAKKVIENLHMDKGKKNFQASVGISIDKEADQMGFDKAEDYINDLNIELPKKGSYTEIEGGK